MIFQKVPKVWFMQGNILFLEFSKKKWMNGMFWKTTNISRLQFPGIFYPFLIIIIKNKHTPKGFLSDIEIIYRVYIDKGGQRRRMIASHKHPFASCHQFKGLGGGRLDSIFLRQLCYWGHQFCCRSVVVVRNGCHPVYCFKVVPRQEVSQIILPIFFSATALI